MALTVLSMLAFWKDSMALDAGVTGFQRRHEFVVDQSPAPVRLALGLELERRGAQADMVLRLARLSS